MDNGGEGYVVALHNGSRKNILKAPLLYCTRSPNDESDADVHDMGKSGLMNVHILLCTFFHGFLLTYASFWAGHLDANIFDQTYGTTVTESVYDEFIAWKEEG